MDKVFDSVYSDIYDDLYQEKDYDNECNILIDLFSKYSGIKVKKILDLGCGTGNHDILLAEKGYSITGMDQSLDMLKIAINKSRIKNLSINYHHSDIRNYNLNTTFDAVLIMFAVLGYQTENDDLIKTLNTARKHINLDGLIIMDIWYGPAVLHQRPSDRVKIINSPESTIIRTSSGELDVNKQVCTVSFNLWKFTEDKLLSKTHEKHNMRFFFAQELVLLLEIAGFKLIRLGAFPEYTKEPSEDTWNIIAIAKAI